MYVKMIKELDYNFGVESDSDPVMFYYECDVQYNKPAIIVTEDFSKKVEFITKKKEREEEKEKEKRKKAQEDYRTKYPNGSKNHNQYQRPNSEPRTPGYYPKGQFNQGEMLTGWGDDEVTNIDAHPDKDKKREDGTFITLEEQFACYVLRLGNELKDDTLEDTMIDIQVASLNTASLATTIEENIGSYYNEFFKNEKEYHTPEKFLQVLEYVVNCYEENVKDGFLELQFTIDKLKELGNKVEDSVKEKETKLLN
jgi:hypothetical protein